MKIHILHLSDLHWIGSPSGDNMKNAILKLAGERFSKLPAGEKLLVLTGDFHNFSEGYQPVKKFLSELVDKMGLDPRQDVFMVPGNHDIDKDSQEDSSREAYIAMCRANPERLNTEGQKRTDYMNTFLSHYKGYLDFVRELGIYSPEECDRQIPVKVHVRTWRDTLHLLHLNTTLVADGTDKTNQLTDTLSATSDEIKNRLLADGLPNIALGHNNLYDMNETQVRTGLRGAFYFGNVSAYLCGDRHRTDKEYDQRRIKLGTDDNDPEIPNICAPRGSSDERDDFSQFGLILHEWDTDTGKVVWTVQLWDREDPSKLTPGRQFTYSIPPPGAARTPDAPKAAETFRQRADRWNLGDAAEILDARTVKKAADNCVQQDIHAFYRVNDSYGVMLRVLAANKGIPREEAEKKISEMLEQGPVLIAGNGGMGKTTLMLRTAIRWAESGGVAVWLNLPRLERGILDGGKARVLMESLRQWAEEGTRVLLCLNSPAGGETALQTLQNAWMHYGLWTENVHLIMAERSARLKNLPILRTDWLNGANVAELRAAGDTWRPFRLEGYRAEIIEEEDAFRRTLLNKTALSYVESGDLSRGQALIGRLNDILTRYNRPNVNIVELIYRALFDLRGLARRSGIVLDWEEWGRTLRKQYGIPDEDFGLYGGIAAFSLFEYPMPLSLFCRRFKLEPQNLTDLLRTWHISKKSGSIEPVSYTPSSRVASYKGDWGTLEPKHDVVAELFFLFHKEDNPDYNESPIDRLMSDYLVIMTEPEIETLFHKMVNRQAMRQMKQRKLGDINYREYMELVYARMQAHELNLSEQGRIDLCLGLLWSRGGERITQWDEKVHEMLENTAPELDGSRPVSNLYTQWAIWLSRNDKDKKAESFFRSVIDIDPRHIPPYTELGKLLAKRKGDKAAQEEAETLFRQAMNIDPNHLQSRTELGKLLARQGRDKDAETLFRQVIRLDNQNVHCRTELGKLLARQGRDKDAETLFRQALAIDPKHIHSRTELGKLLARQGKDKDAETLFRQALAIDPKNLHPHTELGKLLARQGKDKDAEELFRQALAIDPKNIPARHELALLLERTGRKQEAKRLYQEIHSIDSKDDGARSGLERLADVQT